jgi:micrococcal nuclease
MAIIRWKPGAVPGPFIAGVQWAFDGDTLIPAGFSGSRIVRLWGCDAPEVGQFCFLESRRRLLDLVRGRRCSFHPRCLDRYGRVVCRVEVPGSGDLARALLLGGLAWWDFRFAPRFEQYEQAQRSAREAKRGIWSRGRPGYAPWVWRRIHRIT